MLTRPKLIRVISIFLKRKLKELTGDHKKGWQAVGVYVTSFGVFIGIIHLCSIYPMLKKVTKVSLVVIAVLFGGFVVFALLYTFCSWLHADWKASRAEALRELYPDIKRSCLDKDKDCFNCDEVFNSVNCVERRIDDYEKDKES